jgi:hypothetical protein
MLCCMLTEKPASLGAGGAKRFCADTACSFHELHFAHASLPGLLAASAAARRPCPRQEHLHYVLCPSQSVAS